MAYVRKDHFYRRAKKEGKASRAAYKLAELQKRFGLIHRGDVVLDLGCAPGGWMQEASAFVGRNGKVVGVDVLPLKILVPTNCEFVKGDVGDASVEQDLIEIIGGRVDLVLSDMSPNLSGVSFADTYRSYELALAAFSACEKFLKDGGNFVVKIFPGGEFQDYAAKLKAGFSSVSVITPNATRRTSSERYIVAAGYKKTREA